MTGEFYNKILMDVYSRASLSSKIVMKEYLKNKIPNMSEEEMDYYIYGNHKAYKVMICDLSSTHIFTIDKNLGMALQLTKNKVFNRHFPFDSMFIEYSLKIRPDIVIDGFLIKKDKWGTIIRPLYYDNSGLLRIMHIEFFDTYFKFHPDKKLEHKQQINLAEKLSDFCITEKEKQKIRIFFCNLLDFMNTPDVKIITIERTKDQNAKRIKRGKLPIPPIHHITITGELKIYLDKLNSGAAFSYSHKFWVRGHFRTLRSNKWKIKQGTRIWIRPFIKGDGFLINKVYDCESPKSEGEIMEMPRDVEAGGMMELNKIYCMDCLEGMKQIEDNSVDLIVTDPPYNISGLSNSIDLHGKPVNLSHFGDWDYLFNPEEFIKETKRVLKKNGQIYIFTSDRLIGKYIDLFIKYQFYYRNMLVWFKANLMPKIRHRTWRSGTEYILYAGQSKCEKSSDYTFNWLGQEEMKNLIIRNILGGGERLNHPTQKPLDIIKRFIIVSSNGGDFVLDPFIGSGTTAVACKQLGRNFIGFEISSEYYKIAEKRLQQETLFSSLQQTLGGNQ